MYTPKSGALPAIQPGEKDWQVVATRRNRTARVDTRNNKPELARLTPARATDKDSRRLPFRREGGLDGPKAPREEIILAINRGLARNGLPTFLRVVDSGYTATGAISVLLEKGSISTMLIPGYTDDLVTAIRQVDPAVVSMEAPEQWHRVKVHGVPKQRYLARGLELAREEIELGTNYRLKRNPTWLRSPQAIRESTTKGSTMVITVGSREEAQKLLVDGIRFAANRYRTEQFWELRPETVCPRCCGIGHHHYKGCGDRPPLCFICAGPHEGLEHTCKTGGCSAKPGTACEHMPAKCGNCDGKHSATSTSCPKIREVRKEVFRQRHLRVVSQADQTSEAVGNMTEEEQHR